ncbi:MAG: response regulator, partial [Chloroflexi bacterium]|nr:response regulator [Chloroflexota bacterium]
MPLTARPPHPREQCHFTGVASCLAKDGSLRECPCYRESVSDSGKQRIVAINDDTAFLQLLEELLGEMEGFEVHTIKQWDTAYELVRDLQPDLIILDVVMAQEERGWNILELLTLDPRTSS